MARWRRSPSRQSLVSTATATAIALALVGCGATNSITPGVVSISGAVTGLAGAGLAGAGLVLQNGGMDDLAVSANGPFAFATRVPEGAPYSVTVLHQPANPLQLCSIQNGAGTAGAGAQPIAITCATSPSFTLGGRVSGLTEAGLVVANPGSDDLSVAPGATSFSFEVQEGAPYAVSVKAQPPELFCTVQSGSGTMGAGAVTTVAVSCVSDPAFAIGGTVSGLAGAALVLQNSGTDDLPIAADGLFKFPHRLHAGDSYSVAVQTQPSSPPQTCTVTQRSGVVTAAVTSVLVNCAINASHLIGGTVTGLNGQALVLQNEGGDDLSLSQSGAFTFATPLQSGQQYLVTVAAQPFSPDQACSVTGGSGAVGDLDVDTIQVDCTTLALYSIGGSVTGLLGSGLVLQDDGVDDLPIAGIGAFNFVSHLPRGASYSVTVKTQPSAPFQTCNVAKGSGLAGPEDVHTAFVACANNPSFSLGGAVTGLTGAGLVLQDSGGDDLALSQNGAFTFATGLQQGQTWRATVRTQPGGQSCAVTSGGAGMMGTGPLAPIAVTCASTPFFQTQVQVSGLSGSGLVVQNRGADDLSIKADGIYSFANQAQSGAAYAVTVRAQPGAPLQTCTLGGNTTGTFALANVLVQLTCVVNPFFSIRVVASGVAGSGLLLTNNGADTLAIAADGPSLFATRLQATQTWSVAVAAQPSGPFQTCTVTNPRGTVGNADVASIFVICTTNQFYLVGGFATGLEGTGLILQGPGTVSIAADGLFVFPTLLQTGESFSVSIAAQPVPNQHCFLANRSGTVGQTNALVLQVGCQPNPFVLGGAVVGLAGTGLVLQNGNGELLPITASGPFAFTLPVLAQSPYFIRVQAQPTNPRQSCSVFPNNGVAAADVADLTVFCIAATAQLGGTVSGLPLGATVTLQDNAPQTITVAGKGTGIDTFTFTNGLTPGQPYLASVVGGSGASCGIASGGSGTIGRTGNGNLVRLTCVPAFNLSGTVSGLSGSGLRFGNSSTAEILVVGKAATTFAFAQAVTQSQGYALSITAQPTGPAQSCSFDSGAAPVSGNPTADVVTLSVTCVTSAFTVGGAITGLPAGATLSLQDNGADDTTLTGAGDGSAPVPFTFNTPIASGAAYAARISVNTGPVTNCVLASGGSGTVTSGAITNLAVACTPTHLIGGTLSGYTGSGLQLILKNAAWSQTLQTIAVAGSSATFAFTTPVTQAQGYSVSLGAQPAGVPKQICAFSSTSPSPLSGNPSADVTGIALGCSGTTFSVGGSVTGLPSGASVTVTDNGFDRATVQGTVSGAANFTFPTPLAGGSGYSAAVTGMSGPVACTLASGGVGAVNAAVTSIRITCVAGFTLAGTITGLLGSGLQLTNSTTGETLALAKGTTTLAFTHAVSTAQGYSLLVAIQPASPVQTCTLVAPAAATGNPTANVVNLNYACATNSYSVSGAVSGLPAGTSVTLVDNGADAVTVAGLSDGSTAIPFSFPTPVASGQPYLATVSAGSRVSCSVTSNSGTMVSAPVPNLAVSCSPGFSVSGTLAFYSGTGLKLKNGTTNEVLAVPAGQGTFAFAQPVTTAQGYSISVAAQPALPLESCSVVGLVPSPAAGHPTANVTGLPLVCSPATFRVGGAVAGLPNGASVTLINDGLDTTVITSAGQTTPIGFNFPTGVAAGRSYSAAVQATTGAVSCSITAGAMGTVVAAPVTNLTVACAPSFTLGGPLAGYSGTGLQLANSTTGEVIAIPPGRTSFAFAQAVTQPQGYSLSILNQPVNPSQSCALAANSPAPASGNPAANVGGVSFSCTTQAFTVGGVVTGLTGTGLVLQENGGALLAVGPQTADSPAFRFVPPLPSGQSYSISVQTQPLGQVCLPRAGSNLGAVAAGPVLSVILDCSPARSLGGKVTGLRGAGLIVSDGVDALSLSSNGAADVSFVFPSRFAQGQAYSAFVSGQPSSPAQSCAAQGGSGGNNDGSGTLGGADDGSLVISCGAPAYRVGGTLIGVANGGSGSLVLLNNGAEQSIATFTAASTGSATPFQFATPVVQGQPYSVTVQTAPAGLGCIVRNGSGVMGSGDLNTIVAICGYSVTGGFDLGTLNGVTGQLPPVSLVLKDAVTPGTSADPYIDLDSINIPANTAAFAFADPVPYGRACAVSITAAPTGPHLLCSVEPSGSCTGAPVTAAQAPVIRCVPAPGLSLVPFPGAVGSTLGIGSDSSGNLVAAGSCTGAVDLGHGTRTASTFSSGKLSGSGFAAAFDASGFKGSLAVPQSANWDALFPSSSATRSNAGAAKVRAIAVDGAGDVVIAGSAVGSIDFGDGKGAINLGNTESMFLARLSSSGAVVWAGHFGAGAMASVAMNSTQLVVGGVFGSGATSTETFGSPGCASLTSGSAHREFAAAFDFTSGACSYSIKLGAGADPAAVPAPFRLGPAIALDSAGSTILAGNALDAAGITKLAGPYLITYDSSGMNPCYAGNAGNELFADSTAPAGNLATSVAVGGADQIFVGGSCSGAPKLHGAVVSGCNGASPSAFVAVYAARSACQGAALAGAQAGGAPLTAISVGGAAQTLALAADATGALFVAGAYSGSPVLGGAALFAGPGALAQNVFFARFGAGLTAPLLEAASATGALSVTGIALGAGGSAWVSGAYSGQVAYKGTLQLGATAATSEPLLIQFPQSAP